MPKRRKDADTRRFFDEFPVVKVGRFRAMGVIDPLKRQALIPFPNGKTKLLGVQHTKFWNGGGYSYFVCPGCQKRAGKLWLLDDAARCNECCNAMNIQYASRYGFGRQARRQVADQKLDELIAKVTTTEPLRFNPAPASWQGKAKLVYRSRSLSQSMRRDLISLRLHQLAYQQVNANRRDTLKTHQPLPETRSLIDIRPIWQAKSREDLESALDKAQVQILDALQSHDPQIQMAAARLMRRTKQARERGLT